LFDVPLDPPLTIIDRQPIQNFFY